MLSKWQAIGEFIDELRAFLRDANSIITKHIGVKIVNCICHVARTEMESF